MNCFSWSPKECSPCSVHPSSYAAQSFMSTHRRCDVGNAHKFTLAQLSAATDSLCDPNLIGKGGFGMPMAVKQLGRGGTQGSHEFLVECMTLMMVQHPNLVGYCAEAEEERLLVDEFLPRGSLDAHLFFVQ